VLVPAWINNIQRVMPKGEVVPVPILCSVTFGKPMKVERHLVDNTETGQSNEAVEGHAEFAERARNAVIALRDV
jgi:hypothetical protein